MRVAAVAVVVLMSGCIRDDLVDCGNGFACPSGTACVTVVAQATTRSICAPPNSFAPCEGVADGEACDYDGPGTCHGRACLPDVCGNGLRDSREVCDDGNTISGDGCASGCVSNETCSNGVIDLIANEQCDEGNLLAHDGCSSTCQSEALHWEPLQLSLPGGHQLHTMVYDSARDRVVMFGGAYAGAFGLLSPRKETWEWDGAGWSRVPTAITPSARFGQVMAYDPVRRRTVMFGGASSGTIFGDTWEWDGSTWILLSPATSPPPRHRAAAVYDSIRRRIVMFGGDADGELDDTWEWDGTTWAERVATTRPSPRFAHGMAFDPLRGVTVLVGGTSRTAPPNDTWEFDGTSWIASPAATPLELVGAAVAFDGTGVLAFGGQLGAAASAETYRYDGTAWTQPATTAGTPPVRSNAAMAWDPRRGRALLYGGTYFQTPPCAGGCVKMRADAHVWDGSQWTEVFGAAPSARVYAATAFDEHRRTLVLLGGGDMYGSTPIGGAGPAETWELQGDHWVRAADGPTARTRAAMAYDRENRQIVLFGGTIANGSPTGDTWLWNGVMWTQVMTTGGPAARRGHAMAFDPVTRRVLMFGGQSSNPAIGGETWEWSGTAWTQRMPAMSPPPRAHHAMTIDPVRGRILMLGGDIGSETFRDAWEWDGFTWIERTLAVSPPARAFYGLAWNGPRERAVVFGGAAQLFTQFDDIWELSETTATQAFAAGGPGVRQGLSIGPTRDGSGVLVFGGGGESVPMGDLWRLRWATDGATELCTIDVDTDGDGLAGCADPDCWAVCTPLCPPGAPCPATAPRCGDGTCNADLETCRMCPGDCGACAPACGDNFCDPGEAAASCPGDCS